MTIFHVISKKEAKPEFKPRHSVRYFLVFSLNPNSLEKVFSSVTR